MKTYYITGITGFLGYNLAKLISKNNDKIIGFALEGDKNISLYDSFDNVKIIKGNILNFEEVEKFLSTPSDGKKYLIHAAGKITTLKKGDPMVYKINYEGTKNVIRSAKNKGFEKIVYISSTDSMKYRTDKEILKEQEFYNVDETPGQYGKSKVMAINYIKENINNYIIVMPSAILGPDDPLNAAINNSINKAIKNKLPAIVNGGYNLVDVRDVADGILKAIDSNKINEFYLLTGNYISIKDLINKTTEISGSHKVRFVIPHFLIKIISPFIELHAKRKKITPLFTGFSMDCLKQNSNFSNEKAKKDFGFSPRNLNDTLIDTINFLKNKKD